MHFIKHVGKHADRRVAIIYRTIPDEEHMALVIYPDTLSTPFHDSIMKVIESDVGQQGDQLADVLFRSKLSDGRPMLETLHKEGMIKKVQTNQIVVTPNAQSHVRLDELNKIFDGMAAGNDAAKQMADFDANAGLVDPTKRNEVPESGSVLDNSKLADDLIAQSKQMVVESKSILAESKRLEKEAFALNPALKPKRASKKKAAKKKAAKKAS